MSTSGLGGRTHPKLDQEEGMGGSSVVQLPQTPLLLREFVVDLPDVHTLEGGRSRAGAVLADVDEQVPLVLGGTAAGEEQGMGGSHGPHCPG